MPDFALQPNQGRAGASTALLTPRSSSEAQSAGPRRYSKQLLPRGRVKVPGGRVIDFNDDLYGRLTDAFATGAFDSVPLQVAESHTKDPHATEGRLVQLQVQPDGLHGVIEFSDDRGDQLVKKNPNAGVSVSIVENLSRWVDGKDRVWPAALQHVLMTTDPHIVGMAGWKAVDLSAAPASTLIDLSGSTYTDVMEGDMPTKIEDTVTLELPKDQADRLQRLLADDAAIETILAAPSVEQQALAAPGPEDKPEDKPEDEEGKSVAETDLARNETATIELARLEQAEQTIVALQREVIAAQSAAEIERLAKSGLAPSIIELARPLLEAPRGTSTIDLARADGSSDVVDPTEVIRDVLNQVIMLERSGIAVIDLDREEGYSNGPGDPVAQQRTEKLEAMNKMFGR